VPTLHIFTIYLKDIANNKLPFLKYTEEVLAQSGSEFLYPTKGYNYAQEFMFKDYKTYQITPKMVLDNATQIGAATGFFWGVALGGGESISQSNK
jgi:hypothetical protein